MLVTIKDIQNVLEEQETETWQKLIRVLTHEIMNSITPISSLTSTLDLMLNSAIHDHKNLTEESLSEISMAIKTIHKRSNGLLHFVSTYRNLTKIPKPNLKVAKVKELLDDILPLIKHELNSSKVNLEMSTEPESLEIYADTKLIEQVIMNLITNAIHATENMADGKIIVRAFLNKRGRVAIQVIDNGHGILKDVIDKIFIPFFTTKPKGSGIGLSLSKQIMRLHGGSITEHSEPNQGATFTLTF